MKINFLAKKPLELKYLAISQNHNFAKNEKFFSNGYQSWTTSREYGFGDEQKGLLGISKLKIANKFASPCGDYNFTEYGKNLFHGFSYEYLKVDNNFELIGSLSDRTGYTIFYADYQYNKFKIVKDVQGFVLTEKCCLFDLQSFSGSYEEVFDAYFQAMQISKPKIDHLAGYTSWYNYYQKIDENIINRDLSAMIDVAKEKATIFQIDDGYESKVGDWLNVDSKKFPNGLLTITQKIHKHGMNAGLWLAPFSAQRNSVIAKQHKDWLLKDENGKLLWGGIAWGGFYVLDFYNKEARNYIKRCFDTVFDVWNFDMVKLDFLYSACILPRNNKTRGQIMYEAMDFLRECCKDKLILGCGVPLAPSFGVVDACRISSDVENSFKDKYYAKITNQEVVSTKNAMNNTVFRRHLNGRAFVNDPDVFFMREDGPVVPKFSWRQKYLLARINHLFGDVLFVSDNVGNYGEKQKEILLETFEKFDGKIMSCKYSSQNEIEIAFEEHGSRQVLRFNTLTGDFSLKKW